MTDRTKQSDPVCFDELSYAIYLDGEADAQTQQLIEAHLETCDRCRELVGRLQEENRQISASLEPAEHPDVDLVPGVMDAIPAEPEAYEKSNVIPMVRFRRVLPYAATILIAAFLLVFAVLFFQAPPTGDIDDTGGGETRVILCRASVDGQTVEGHIFEDKDEPDIQFIWLEKE